MPYLLEQTACSLSTAAAENLVTAPASQTYVERVFSLCGLLTTGCRNRLSKNLEMRVSEAEQRLGASVSERKLQGGPKK